MSHELDMRANGVAAMFSVRETPWHRLGTVIQDIPTIEEALHLGGLDFHVETQPIFTKRHVLLEDGDSFEKTEEIEGFKATMRMDRHEVLGVVGSRYTPLQNRDAFKILQPLLDAGLATLETGGVLRQGRDVWVMVRFHVESPLVTEVFGTEVVPFGLLSNNHAGQRQVLLQETPIRVVCANTLGMAQRSALKGKSRVVKVRHTLTVEAKTTKAVDELWGGIISRYEEVARQYRLLKRAYLDDALFRKLVLDTVAPIPKKLADPETSRQRTSLAKIEAQRERLTSLWTEGEGHTGDHSAWEAYNAVTQSIDHDDHLWRVRGEGRLQALMTGRLGQIKQTTIDTLLDFALETV